ncbi:type II toxin-antitoxin system RelE/ParE family toxin [Bradyrhizobium sp. STM 3809]|uniref:type II toxin-antitoxin system RelE/ParE family toxin n=1 Tax=Bradyrhizobium sp. STM 3809 TaxID=551936 RepID=UPI0002406AD8|nr:type II toxin-antitoxin system RelE/ParE family toxin [Bradyrhizobium sp. STM 3809]CCD97639.1 conserved hypothetical protein [Bradyrhizobium sp. STM 3809]
MKIYKLEKVAQFTKSERISDETLVKAIDQAQRGLVDAELGSGLIKLRVARPGEGKSGGYRMLIAFRSGDRSVFLFGFAKNERDNIDSKQLKTLREASVMWLQATPQQIAAAIRNGLLIEVRNGKDN